MCVFGRAVRAIRDEACAVVLLGSSGVGKSNLMTRFVSDRFQDRDAATVGVDFASKLLETNDGTRVRAQIWDTGTQCVDRSGRDVTVSPDRRVPVFPVPVTVVAAVCSQLDKNATDQ